jgi:hypothetical protein
MAGRPPDQLRDLRFGTEEAIEDTDDEVEQRQLQWRIESIDRELSSPFAGANLDGANLDGAYLAGANLDGAKNLPAGIAAVDPPEPYTLPPQTVAAQLERAQRYRVAHPDVPVVDQIDVKILARVEANPACFDMKTWHCGTTHCRAGQAVDIAGTAGYELERKLGDPARAGAMIYMASVGFVPWFYDPSNEHALKDIRRCAAEQAAARMEPGPEAA